MTILSPKETERATGLSRSTLWRKSRAEHDPFPIPIQLSANRIGWHDFEIRDWLDARPRGFLRPGSLVSNSDNQAAENAKEEPAPAEPAAGSP